jgi:hypothetical protein
MFKNTKRNCVPSEKFSANTNLWAVTGPELRRKKPNTKLRMILFSLSLFRSSCSGICIDLNDTLLFLRISCPIRSKNAKSILKRVIKRNEEKATEFKQREEKVSAQTEVCKLLSSRCKDINIRDVILEKGLQSSFHAKQLFFLVHLHLCFHPFPILSLSQIPFATKLARKLLLHWVKPGKPFSANRKMEKLAFI